MTNSENSRRLDLKSTVMIMMMLHGCHHLVADARSTGAPVDQNKDLCDSMTPGHFIPPQTSTCPYFISVSSESYQPGDNITVTVTTNTDLTSAGFKGIFMQMRRSDTEEIVGSWVVPDPTNFQTVSCGGAPDTAVTHTNSEEKEMTNIFLWSATTGVEGDIQVVASFVQSFTIYWVKETSETIRAVTSNLCDPNPCLSSGTCVPEGNTFSCICPPPFAGPTCHYIVFPCDSNPCANNGTCQDVNDDTDFACMCENGFTGKMCEEVIASNPCDPSPCLSGGTCVPEGNDFSCRCPPPFSGPTCHYIVFPCDSSPCANNGSCEDVDDTEFVCMCKDGFTGTLCEQVIASDPCDPNPCLSGGTCLPDGSCICPPPFEGPTCHYIMLPCSSNPCANDGTCVETNGNMDFECLCRPGYIGDMCETSRLHIPFDLCLNNKCQNGASCEVNYMHDQYTYTCTCAEGFTGTFCETAINGLNPGLSNFIRPTGEGDKLAYNIYLVFLMLVVANVVALFIN